MQVLRRYDPLGPARCRRLEGMASTLVGAMVRRSILIGVPLAGRCQVQDSARRYRGGIMRDRTEAHFLGEGCSVLSQSMSRFPQLAMIAVWGSVSWASTNPGQISPVAVVFDRCFAELHCADRRRGPRPGGYARPQSKNAPSLDRYGLYSSHGSERECCPVKRSGIGKEEMFVFSWRLV